MVSVVTLSVAIVVAAATQQGTKASEAMKDWLRPQYAKGGAEAFLAYAVYGSQTKLEVSGSRHRTKGLPPGVSARSGSGCDEFRSGAFASMLAKDEPAMVKAVSTAEKCVIVMGSVPDPHDLNYLRDTVGVLTAMWDAGAVAIFDMQALRWFSRSRWFSEIFDPDDAVPRRHVSILWSEDPADSGRLWFHTRGMRKFGRPDVSVVRVPPGSREAVIHLCNRFIETMAFGAVIPEGQPIKVKGLPTGLSCHHAGSVEDPEFNNVNVEIEWPK